jgi:hypothetical protein
MRKVILNPDDVQTLIQLLQKSKDVRSAGMIHSLREKTKSSLLMDHCFELAQEKHQYQEGNVEVDEDAVVSLSENPEITGAYVQAWTWVDLSAEDKRRFRIPLDEFDRRDLREKRKKKREEVLSP